LLASSSGARQSKYQNVPDSGEYRAARGYNDVNAARKAGRFFLASDIKRRMESRQIASLPLSPCSSIAIAHPRHLAELSMKFLFGTDRALVKPGAN
jgi:hypothetical protein